MKSFFTNCFTIDEAKNLFKKLVFELHPDTSGRDSQSEFIKMFTEFKQFRPSAPSNNESDQNFNAEAFYNIVQNFNGLQDVIITFAGSFIWLEDEKAGATKAQKELIKQIKIDGFNTAKFAFKRLKWYFSPEGYKQNFKSKKSFEDIKNAYGSKQFSTAGKINFQIA